MREEKKQPDIIWINIDGLKDVRPLGEIGDLFGLHPLIVEDILNTDQRPKMEDFNDYTYIVLKNFHTADVSGGCLWHEFQTHAGTGMGLRLFWIVLVVGNHVDDRGHDAYVFPQEEMALMGQQNGCIND